MPRKELFGFDEDDADKIVRVAREYDRNMGSRVVAEDERTSDRTVAVRLTGPRSAAASNMYPGQIVGWKPGPLAVADPSGSADSTSFVEYDEHWYAGKNEDGEVADDCWVIVSPRDVGILPADPTGVILNGIVVGQHPTTQTSIVLHSFRPGEFETSGSGGSGGSGSGGAVDLGRLIGTKVSRVICAAGILFVYVRDQFQDATMRVTDGPERFGNTAGCCDCSGGSGSGGSGSGGSGSGGTGSGGSGSGCTGGYVEWEWDGSIWNPVGGGCNDARQAQYPGAPGTSIGQRVITCCVALISGGE